MAGGIIEAALALTLRPALDADLAERSLSELARAAFERARNRIFSCRPAHGTSGIELSMVSADTVRARFRNCGALGLRPMSGVLVARFARNADRSVRVTLTTPLTSPTEEPELRVGADAYHRLDSVIDISRTIDGFSSTSVRSSYLVLGSNGQWVERDGTTPGRTRATLNIESGCFTVMGEAWSTRSGASPAELSPRCVALHGYRRCGAACPNVRANAAALYDGLCTRNETDGGVGGSALVSIDFLGTANFRWRTSTARGTLPLMCND
jgi:hypothetical protein